MCISAKTGFCKSINFGTSIHMNLSKIPLFLHLLCSLSEVLLPARVPSTAGALQLRFSNFVCTSRQGFLANVGTPHNHHLVNCIFVFNWVLKKTKEGKTVAVTHYLSRNYRVGLTVMLSTDISDPVLNLSKLVHYLGLENVSIQHLFLFLSSLSTVLPF